MLGTGRLGRRVAALGAQLLLNRQRQILDPRHGNRPHHFAHRLSLCCRRICRRLTWSLIGLLRSFVVIVLLGRRWSRCWGRRYRGNRDRRCNGSRSRLRLQLRGNRFRFAVILLVIVAVIVRLVCLDGGLE